MENANLEAKPYVNGAMLQQNVGRTVCAIGKICKMAPSLMEFQVLLADGKEVKVQLEDQLIEPLEGYVQLVARVNRDCSLICEHIVSFGSGEIDLDIYNQVLNSISSHPDLFSASEINGVAH